MSDASTLSVVLAFAGICLTQLVVWNSGRTRSNKTDGKIDVADSKIDVASANADTAAVEAATAARRTAPISNGFAGRVIGSLEELARGQAALHKDVREVRQKLDKHIGDHAAADVRRRSIEG